MFKANSIYDFVISIAFSFRDYFTFSLINSFFKKAQNLTGGIIFTKSGIQLFE